MGFVLLAAKVFFMQFVAIETQNWLNITNVRLANNVSSANGVCGRVEVKINNMWVTVCDDFWDDLDAFVVCRYLGYSGGTAYQQAADGQETEIFLYKVNCTGFEASLNYCPFSSDAICTNAKEAGVCCNATGQGLVYPVTTTPPPPQTYTNIYPSQTRGKGCPVEPCSFGKFCFDGTITICVGCYSACYGCTGPGPDECQECAVGYDKDSEGCTPSRNLSATPTVTYILDDDTTGKAMTTNSTTGKAMTTNSTTGTAMTTNATSTNSSFGNPTTTPTTTTNITTAATINATTTNNTTRNTMTSNERTTNITTTTSTRNTTTTTFAPMNTTTTIFTINITTTTDTPRNTTTTTATNRNFITINITSSTSTTINITNNTSTTRNSISTTSATINDTTRNATSTTSATTNDTTRNAISTTSATINGTTRNATSTTSATINDITRNATSTTSAIINATSTTSAIINDTTRNATSTTSATINATSTTSATINGTTRNATSTASATINDTTINGTTRNATSTTSAIINATSTTYAIINDTTRNATSTTSATINATSTTSATINGTTRNATSTASATINDTTRNGTTRNATSTTSAIINATSTTYAIINDTTRNATSTTSATINATSTTYAIINDTTRNATSTTSATINDTTRNATARTVTTSTFPTQTSQAVIELVPASGGSANENTSVIDTNLNALALGLSLTVSNQSTTTNSTTGTGCTILDENTIGLWTGLGVSLTIIVILSITNAYVFYRGKWNSIKNSINPGEAKDSINPEEDKDNSDSEDDNDSSDKDSGVPKEEKDSSDSEEDKDSSKSKQKKDKSNSDERKHKRPKTRKGKNVKQRKSQFYWNKNVSFIESRYIVASQLNKHYDPESFWSYCLDDTGKRKIQEHPSITDTSLRQTKNSDFKNEFDSQLQNTWLPPIQGVQKRRFSSGIQQDPCYSHFWVEIIPVRQSECSLVKQYHYITCQDHTDIDKAEKMWSFVFHNSIKTVVFFGTVAKESNSKKPRDKPHNRKMVIGDLLLELVQKSKYANFIVWVIRVKRQTDGPRTPYCTVRLYEFKVWPEHGVPDDPIPFLDMRCKIRQYQGDDPILVQSRANDGRVGVYTAVDSLIQQYAAQGGESGISVCDFVRRLNTLPSFMVRTYEQYVFIYESIWEEFHAGETRLDITKLKANKSEKILSNSQTGKISCQDQHRCLRRFTRWPDLVPLPKFINADVFLNAIFVDGYRKKKQFIMTETPQGEKFADFYRLVCDNHVQAVVMIGKDEPDSSYISENRAKQKTPFFIEDIIDEQDDISIRTLEIPAEELTRCQSIIMRQFQFKNWSDQTKLPPSERVAVDQVFRVLKYQQSKDLKKIMIHCEDGISHSGLFVALLLLGEKMIEEDVVDVYHTIKHFVRQHPQILKNVKQFQFCYQCLPMLRKKVQPLRVPSEHHATIERV